jgi:hypothetical protein
MENENVPTTLNDVAALRTWAKQIESEIGEITSAIAPLQQRLDAAREKLDLVRRLIHLSADTSPSTAATMPLNSSSTLPPTSPDVEDRIEQILLQMGHPMHIREIRASLIEQGVPLPGRGDEANIILRLRRARDRFIRTERGTYGLAAWQMTEYAPAPKKKTIRKRKKSNP